MRILTDPDIAVVLDMVSDYKCFGALPEPGDMLDQPLWIYQALKIAEEEIERAKADQNKEVGDRQNDLVKKIGGSKNVR